MRAIQQVNKLKHLSFGSLYLGNQFKMPGRWRQGERQKSSSHRLAKQQLCMSVRHFFWYCDVNKIRRNFLSFSELGCDSQEFISRTICLLLTTEVGSKLKWSPSSLVFAPAPMWYLKLPILWLVRFFSSLSHTHKCPEIVRISQVR